MCKRLLLFTTLNKAFTMYADTQALSFWLKHCIWNTIRCIFWSLAKEFFGSTFRAIYALWIDAYYAYMLVSFVHLLARSHTHYDGRKSRKIENSTKSFTYIKKSMWFFMVFSFSISHVCILRTIQSFFFYFFFYMTGIFTRKC